MQTIAAGEFKAKCLKIMNLVHDNHEEFLVTKNGKPFAKMVPVESENDPFNTCLKDTVKIHGDIVSYELNEDWEIIDD